MTEEREEWPCQRSERILGKGWIANSSTHTFLRFSSIDRIVYCHQRPTAFVCMYTCLGRCIYSKVCGVADILFWRHSWRVGDVFEVSESKPFGMLNPSALHVCALWCKSICVPLECWTLSAPVKAKTVKHFTVWRVSRQDRTWDCVLDMYVQKLSRVHVITNSMYKSFSSVNVLSG